MAVVNFQFADTDFEVISVKDDTGEIWMLANPFARILEYSNAPKAISMFVSQKNQCCYYNIQSVQIGQITSSLHPKSKFINRAGIFELIQSSRMPKAQEFKNWINSDLLPKLCDEGKYDMITDAPAGIAVGMNAVHAVVNNGAEASWAKDMAHLKNAIVEKDRRIDELAVALKSCNDKLVVFANALVDCNKGLISANERTDALAHRMADIAQDVIAKPSDPQLLHSLAVCAMGGDQYAFLRPQRRSLKRSLDRLSVDEKDIVFRSDYVPNSMNVLNKVKERLPKDKYKARHNRITLREDLTRDDLIEVINSTLTPRQVAVAAKKPRAAGQGL